VRIEELRAKGRQPRVHGNGFIQLDLNDEGTRRLHVWHDDIPRQEIPTPIHDHVFALRSKVIAGTLIHEELETIETASNAATHRVFRAQQEPGTQNTILVPDEGVVELAVGQRLVLGAGSVYTFPAWKLHQTDYRGTTATIMDKVESSLQYTMEHDGMCNDYTGCNSGCQWVPEYGRPRVLVPIGAEPDNNFRRDAHDPETLWPFIERALELARAMEEI
jgi:hypothetical protein